MIPISVCIITKNEADYLEQNLKALKNYPFEIVVTDTGSTDASRDVAGRYADKVYDFAWCNDFSAAKNFCLGKASHNMILMLDTDEVITHIDLDALYAEVEKNPQGIGMIELYNYFDIDGVRRAQIQRLGRLFNRKYYSYQGKIHEYLEHKNGAPLVHYEVPIVADHFGYTGSKEKLEEKSLRNIALLQEDLEKNPNNPYLLFQIGQSYMMMRDNENAFTYLAKAMEFHPNPAEEYTRILVQNYGNLLIGLDRAQDALSLLSYYDYYKDYANYLCLVGQIYVQLNEPLKALPEFINALTAPKTDNPEARKIIPSFYIGHIYQCFGQNDIAISHFEKCGDYPPAIERLKMLKSEAN